MKKSLILIFLFVLLSIPFLVFGQKQPNGFVYDVNILSVKDGDTISIEAPFLPKPLKPELSVRIYGVDTPEKGFRAKCQQEERRGLAATEFTKNVISKSKERKVVLYDWDKFGGRVLGDFLLDGKSLRSLLISNGFAREYYGDAKVSWC